MSAYALSPAKTPTAGHSSGLASPTVSAATAPEASAPLPASADPEALQPVPPTSAGSTPSHPSSHPTPHPVHQDVETLGDEIARLSAHIQAAQYQLLTLLRQFDEAEGWASGGFRSCAHWLSWRTGLSLGPARERIRVAHALADLPLISARMERGQFSYSKVRALTRVATEENEEELIEFTEHADVGQVERLVRGWRRLDRDAAVQEEEAREEEMRHEGRYLTLHVDDDGMMVIRGRLTPEVGELLRKALEAQEAELFKADRESSPGQRRADALGEVLRSPDGPSVHVLLHVAEDGSRTEEGWSRLEHGVGVSAETSRRMSCDAVVTEVHRATEGMGGPGDQTNGHGGGRRRSGGAVLDVGRARRTVSGRLRTALEVRDEGRCRFPGCSSTRCDAHHIKHWSRGGETKLGNLVLLCRFHHRAVHEGGFKVAIVGGGVGTGVSCGLLATRWARGVGESACRTARGCGSGGTGAVAWEPRHRARDGDAAGEVWGGGLRVGVDGDAGGGALWDPKPVVEASRSRWVNRGE